LSTTLVIVKSLPFMLETFSPLGAVSFPRRFPAAFVVLFELSAFFLIVMVLTSVRVGRDKTCHYPVSMKTLDLRTLRAPRPDSG
jgi:hypothetical protein